MVIKAEVFARTRAIDFFEPMKRSLSRGLQFKNVHNIWFEEAPLSNPSIQKYDFKGEIDIEMIVNSAVEDNRRSFIVMGEKNALVGIIRGADTGFFCLRSAVEYSNGNFISPSFAAFHSIYFFVIIPKEDVSKYVKILKEERLQFEKKIKTKKSKIRRATAVRNRSPKKAKAERFQVLTF